MADRSKNKWSSQQTHKKFKNAKRKFSANCDMADDNDKLSNLKNFCRNYQKSVPVLQRQISDEYYYIAADTITSVPSNQYSENTFGDYLEPECDCDDDMDEEMQWVIASSLQQSQNNWVETEQKQMKKTQKCRKQNNYHSFAAYWAEMTAFIECNKDIKKYIIDSLKTSTNKRSKKVKKDNSAVETGKSALRIIAQHPTLSRIIPSKHSLECFIRDELSAEDVCIQSVVRSDLLNRFLQRRSGAFELVYHGTSSVNNHSICSRGLIVGGTNGVSIANGSAYGRGVYCSPNLGTARCYARGSLFICLINANVRKSGSIYVVGNDHDIIPLYLVSFRYDGTLTIASNWNNQVIEFSPGWHPLNLNEKASRDRKVRRKWSSYDKLSE
jgi:hypothetical protein